MPRTVIAIPLLSACASVSVGGTVQGVTPELFEAVYVEVPGAYPTSTGADGAVRVSLVGFPDACEALAEFQRTQLAPAQRAQVPAPEEGAGDGDVVPTQDAGEADEPTEAADAPAPALAEGDAFLLAETWRDLFPETHWRVDLTIRTRDAGDLFDGTAFDGTDWERQPGKSDEFRAELVEHTRYLDEAYFSGARPEANYLSRWINDEGTLELDRTTRKGDLVGRMTVDVVDADDGSQEGTLQFSFVARDCPELVEAVE